MNRNTRLLSVDRDELDADCVLVTLKVNLGTLDDSDVPMLASQNRMAGERLFLWLFQRVPQPVFDGFMGAARRNGPNGFAE